MKNLSTTVAKNKSVTSCYVFLNDDDDDVTPWGIVT